MEFNFFGRGSAFNTKEGNTSAYTIDEFGDMLLIDCGENIFSKMMDSGVLNYVNRMEILITHTHPDHIGSLGSLIFYCYYIKHIDVKIDMTKEISEYLSLSGVTHNMYESMKTDRLSTHGFRFAKNEIDHVPEIKSYSYFFANERGEHIFYSGDTNNVAQVKYYSEYRGCIVYTDCCVADYDGNVHLSLMRLNEHIEKENRNRVFCMHFDSDSAIQKAKELGFNVVKVE